MTDKLRKTIGWWQIVCGLLGLVVFAASWLDIPANGQRWVQQVIGPVNFFFGLLFFAFATVAGRGLLHGQRWAAVGSLGIQLVQAVSFAFLNGPQMNIGAGPAIDFTIGSSEIGLRAGFRSSFFLGTLVQGPQWSVTLNVLAIVWALLLFRYIRSYSDVAIAAMVVLCLQLN